MAITKTGITLSATGEADKTFELDGQQSSVSATDLTPNKQYTVSAYIVDSGWGKIDSVSTSSFQTLPEGQITLSNVTSTWDPDNPEMDFKCSWASTYQITAQSSNFRIFVSKNANFNPQSEETTTWTRQSDGLSGTLQATLTQRIPDTYNSPYYVKCQFTDIYGEVRTETFRYNTPDYYGYIDITDRSDFQNGQMRFEADYQMGRWAMQPDTIQVIVYDENGEEIADFQPSIISGDENSGTIGFSDVIEIGDTRSIKYIVKCENEAGYTNSDGVDIDLTQQGS